ncbi:hypothetical protein DFH09DRAFT_293467 [Mycena vulgaris]|nr:hypothetical protein DFH09DRAFT_293467 [Mycena vulgaris]
MREQWTEWGRGRIDEMQRRGRPETTQRRTRTCEITAASSPASRSRPCVGASSRRESSAGHGSVCGRSWQRPAYNEYRSARCYCCCRATSPSSTRVIQKAGYAARHPRPPPEREASRLAVRRTRRVRFPPPSPPPSTVARARPSLAFPLLAHARTPTGSLTHPRKHPRSTAGGGSALRASEVRAKMYSSQERTEAAQSQSPLHLLPGYATQRGVVHRLLRPSTSACNAPRRSRAVSPSVRPAKQTRATPSPTSSASAVPPQTEAAAALNGRRRRGRVEASEWIWRRKTCR